MAQFKTLSKKMQKINQMVIKTAPTDATVLIIGEKGVGKSACARRIHDSSFRADKKFIKLSYTVLKDKLDSIINSNADGTLYIEEVCKLNEEEQRLLLSVFNYKRTFRLIVSATKSIESMVKKGIFLEELYHNLCIVQINIPALKERKEDIPYIIEYFMNELAKRHGKLKTLSAKAYEKLVKTPWPGNILELESILEYAYMKAADKDIIDINDFAVFIRDNNSGGESLHDELYNIASGLTQSAEQSSIYAVFEEYKKLVMPPLVKAALDNTDNNKSKAAELLGINRNTLNKLIREYNIES